MNLGFWDSFTSTAPEIIQVILVREVQITLVILAALMIDYFLKNTSPRYKYILWLVVLFSALWPPFVPLPQLPIPHGSAPVLVSLDPLFRLINTPVSSLQGAISLPQIDQANPSLTIGTVVLLIWLGISIGIGGLILLDIVRLRRNLRAPYSQPFPFTEKVSPTGRHWPPISVNDKLQTAVSVGILRPHIYLSRQLVNSGLKNLKAVLCHEIAHITRRDIWLLPFQLVTLIVHPFNPLVWLMNSRLNLYRDEICDNFALQHSNLTPREYGLMLIEQVANGHSRSTLHYSAAHLVQDKRNLARRLIELSRGNCGVSKWISRKNKLFLTTFALIVFSMMSQTSGNYDVINNNLAALSSVLNLNAKFHATHYPVGSFPDLHNKEIISLIENHTQSYYESVENRMGSTLIIRAFIGPSGKASQISVLQGPEDCVEGASMLVTGTIKAIEDVNWIWYDQKIAESGVWMAILVQFGIDRVISANTRFVITGAENLSSMKLDHPVEYAMPPNLLSDLIQIDTDLALVELSNYPPWCINNVWIYINESGRVDMLSWWPGVNEEIISVLVMSLQDSEWQPALKGDGTPVGSWVNVVLRRSDLGLLAQSF